MALQYFTLQITYSLQDDNNKYATAVSEFKDIEGEHNLNTLQERLFVKGFKIQLTPASWELVSPFRVVKVLAFLQDKKYSL